MKALRKTQPEYGVKLVDVEEPASPDPDEVIVEVEAAGICGSDLHVYEWTSGYEWMVDLMPVTLGHEFAGSIVDRGNDARHLPLGSRVTVWPSYAGGSCAYCKAGIDEHCKCRRTIGLKQDGGFSRYVKVPASQCFILPAEVDSELGALSEPLAVGANAVDVAGVAAGEHVVVLGPGPIGLAIVRFAKMAGAASITVIGYDDSFRLGLSRALGVDKTFDLSRDSNVTVAAVINEMTDDLGAHHVFEATGVAKSINQGLELVRWGGIVTAVGIHHESLNLPLTDFVRQRKQIRGAHGSTAAAWTKVLESLHLDQEALRQLVTHRFSLEDGLQAFEAARKKESGKVMLVPELFQYT